jgi:hypothetical protein
MNQSFFYSSPIYQDNLMSPASSVSQGFKGHSVNEYSQSGQGEDSGEWVWSNAASNNDRSESKNATKTSRNSSENGDNLLIDFGDKKKTNAAKKTSSPAVTAVKTKTAEEEAWDMLNS